MQRKRAVWSVGQLTAGKLSSKPARHSLADKQLSHPGKAKVKLSLCSFLTEHHAIKACWGSGGIAPRILDLGTRWRLVVSFTPRPIYPQGNPLDRRLSGSQSWFWRGGEYKISQSLPGLEPPIIKPVAQRCTTELCRLLMKSCSQSLIKQ
jgi:hypothetical protein